MSKLTPGWQKTSVLESVFDQLSDALVLYDPEFRITGVNRSAEKLLGKSSEEMLGRHCQEVLGLEKAPSEAHQTLLLDIGNRLERLVAMRTCQIFDNGGRLAGTAATIRDIAE